MKQLLKSLISTSLISACGYRKLRHLGRWLSATAGADGVSDDWTRNGEEFFVDTLMRAASNSGSPVTILEVGSNYGQQTSMMMTKACRNHVPNCCMHLFEPSAAAHAGLSQTLKMVPPGITVQQNRMAVGATTMQCRLNCFDSVGGGINSLYEHRSVNHQALTATIESVEMVTIDGYVEEHGIGQVLLLKIDTEGNDMDVLLGARECIERGVIDFIQFEYNSTWIAARRYLCDAFDLLLPNGYWLGKLRHDSVERFTCWNYRLEWFEHCNYVAWRAGIIPPFRVDTTERYLAL